MLNVKKSLVNLIRNDSENIIDPMEGLELAIDKALKEIDELDFKIDEIVQRERESQEEKKKIYFQIKVTTILIVLLIFVLGVVGIINIFRMINPGLNGEYKKVSAITIDEMNLSQYARVNYGDEDIEGIKDISFNGFFLHDIDSDGYSDAIYGTCRNVGSTDTLYMELSVRKDCMLKNGAIEIHGDNFGFEIAGKKDSGIKDFYTQNNVSIIELDDISNESYKLIPGIIKCNKSNKYNSENKIIFTGTYVDYIGNEFEIKKEIELSVDWIGMSMGSAIIDKSQVEE